MAERLPKQDRIRLRATLRERDGDNCNWCGKPMEFAISIKDEAFATIEHLTPRWRGGSHDLANLVLAHRISNQRRNHANIVLPPVPDRAGVQWLWIERADAHAGDPQPLVAALADTTLPAGEGYAWVAAEAGVTQAIRAHLTEVIGHPLPWLRASGYWAKGHAQE